ncbi:ABC transporter substrate-binding protein [Inhella proteolytica]|uniref:Bicyclomycin resistance protein n=1 Tax=Inhella proteolytica TaxID=2795029 RepID=A0A931J233_9BURK|nr:ABC transporter substrate-binding protein [Inhella proteolytica]MBH9577313.1 bicyclomycin resistance protein [Inhella proteolytica]
MKLDRRQTLAAALLPLAAASRAQAPARPKVFRMAFQIAETGFDPARISDIYSRIVTSHIFEALYGYDPLARPARLVPRIATALPETNADFTVHRIQIRRGIYFQDDPAFKGAKRELVAQDFIFALMRFADPKTTSPMWPSLEEQGIVGLAELRRRALESKQPFNYDARIEGLQAPDRYTLVFKLKAPRPRLVEILAQNDLFGAMAREVVEAYGDEIQAHPVGTGPYRLAQWRRSSLIVLERNPSYREVYYETAATDPEALRIAAHFKGKRLPLIDRVEISPIEESQPRWLSFLNGEHDFIERIPPEFIDVALPGGKLAPNLAKRGMQLYRHPAADCAFTFFNMEDPQLGGYEPHRVALRRAISLCLDVEAEIRRVRRGQAVVAQSLVLPHTTGYDPAYKSENGDYDPAKAKALLDLYGYKDRDGDGYREHPDGSPLTIEIASQPDSLSRQFDELWNRNLRAIGLRPKFFHGKWPEQLKQARAGKLQLWMLGNTASYPDGIGMLQRLYGPQAGQQNYSRFKLAAFDRLYEKAQLLPDGPERDALFHEAKRIQAAYMPMKVHVHRLINDMAQPWVIGYRRQLFWVDLFQNLDIDLAKLPA